MAIFDSQKVDYLWKKLGYGRSKTDVNSIKNATNESIASPLFLRGDVIWSQSNLIPSVIPGATTGVVEVYSSSSPIECTNDITSSSNRTWKTGQIDWIPPEIGDTYLIKVYVHTSSDAANASSSGTQLFAAGSGNDDEWFFDYQSGTLNFIGDNLPNGVNFTGKSVYIVGARYTGIKGVSAPGSATNFTDVTVSGDLDVDGHTDLDNVSISGVTTTSGLLDIDAGGQANTFKVEDLTDNRIVISGTGGELEDDANLTFDGSTLSVGVDLDVDGQTELDHVNVSGVSTFVGAADFNGDVDIDGRTELDITNIAETLNVTGISTFASAVDINADLDVDGRTELDITNISETLNVVGVSTFASNVDINADIDVDGHTNLDNVNVSGAATVSGKVDVDGGLEANTAIIEDLTDNRVVISGPGGELEDDANLTFDGSTLSVGVDLDVTGDLDVDGHTELDQLRVAGVSTFAGDVDISSGGNLTVAGNLIVDGTQTILNTTQLEVEDINIGIASADPKLSNAALDGAGITIHGADGDKTLTWNNANSRMEFNTDLHVPNITSTDLTLTGDLDVDGQTELDHVNVSGVSTFASNVDINSDLDVDGRTELDTTNISETLNVAGISTFASAVDINADLDVDGRTELDITNISETLNVVGVSTFTSSVDINSDLDVDGRTELDITNIAETLNVTGISTFASAVDINADLDVDGHTDLDNVSISGVTTVAGTLDANGGLEANTAKVEDLTDNRVVIAGVGGELEDDANLTFNGSVLDLGVDLDVDGRTELDITNISETLNVSGISTFASNVDINADLDVDGRTELDTTNVSDTLNVVGISTFASAVDINADLDVDGRTELDTTNISETLNVTGISTFASDVDINADLDVDGRTELDITNIAETLNVVGVSTFASDVDINADLDVDGRTELDITNIAETLNVTGISTFGSNVDINADLDVDGHTDLDNVSISGVTTTSGLLDIDAGGQANTFKVEDLTDNRVVISGPGGELEDDANLTFNGSTLAVGVDLDVTGDLDIDGHTNLDNVSVSGVTTFTGAIDANGDLDVDGQTELDHVNVSGVSTFVGAADFNGDVDIDGHTNLDNVSISGVATVTGKLDANGGLEANTAIIEDLTDNRVVISGPGGELEDDANFTFNGTELSVGVNLDVDGRTELDITNISETLNVTGVSTFASAVDINADLDVDGRTELDITNIAETLNVTGISTFASAVDINADLDVDGRTELDITNISETLNVTGISTFDSAVDINADLDVDGRTELDITNIAETLNVVGVSTFASNVDINSNLDVDGHTDLDNVNISGVTTTSGLLDIDAGGQANTFKVEDLTDNRVVISGPGGELEDDANLIFNGTELSVGVNLDVDGRTELDITNISETLNVTGITTLSSLNFAGGTAVTAILDEDTLVSNRDDALATQQSIKSYVDSQVTAQDLDFGGDSGTGSVDLDSQSLTISGTTNEIETNASGQTLTIGLPNNVTITQDLTVLRDVEIARNLQVDGNITVGGTDATLFTETLRISDPDIILGVRTDANGEDVATDSTANHGGIAIASTEGNPLTVLSVTGIETLPPTYKKIMWFKEGTFSGLGTDAWLINYAVGIGSTQFPTGTRLAAGSVQFSEYDLEVVRNINASGVLDVDGLSELDDVNVSGAATVAGTLDANGGLQANTAIIEDLTDNRVVIAGSGGELEDDTNLTYDGVDLSTNSLIVTDLTDNRILLAGTGGAVEDDGNLTFNGTQLAVGVDLDVDGHTELDNLNVSGVSTFASAVDINADLDVDGHTDLDNVSISGVTTTSGLLDIDAGGQANTFKVEDLTDNRVVISGPGGELEDDANLTFNGSTLAVGVDLNVTGDLDVDGHTELDNVSISGVTTFTGNIDANGDLDVDGLAELDDVNVSGAATVAGTFDANGGLTANTAIIEDLTENRVVISGPGGELEDDANLTFDGSTLSVGVDLDVDGTTELDVLNVAETATFSSNIDANGDLDVDGHTDLDNVSISGVTTTSGLLDIDAGGQANTFKVEDLTDNRVVIVGTGGELEDDANLTFNGSTLAVGVDLNVTGDLDVDGHTELDDLRVSGVSTFTGAIDANGDLDVDGHTELDDLNVSGVSTFTGAADFNGDIDVDGQTELDHVNVSGVATITSAIITNTTFGSGTAITSVDTDLATVSSSDDTLASAKAIKTYIDNQVTVQDLDFGGDSGTGSVDLDSQSLTISGTTNEIETSASDQTITIGLPDDVTITSGLTVGAGITVTGISTFASDLDVNGGLDVDGHTELDNLNVSGVTTFQSHVHLGDGDVLRFGDSNDLEILHSGTSSAIRDLGTGQLYLQSNGGGVWITSNGANEKFAVFTDSSVDLYHSNVKKFETTADGIDVTGHTETDTLRVSGLSTFTNAVDINNDLDVDGTTELDVLNVAETATFSANIDANGDLDVDGHTDLDNVSISGVTTTSGLLDVDSGLTANTAIIEDLTDNRVIIAGVGGELEDDANLTYDGTDLSSNSLIVTDLTDNRVLVAGVGGAVEDDSNLTFDGSTLTVGVDLDVDGRTELDITNIAETLNVVGVSTFASNVDMNADLDVDGHTELDNVNISGVATATAFHTGAEGSAIRVSSDTISGPATLNIDPSAVGDNTGTVVIKGDLQVDGTQTVINSTTVTVNDLNIQVADGAANDAAADGAGITVNSGEGNKTFQFEATGDNFGSSEHLNLASGKKYKINNTDVLSANGLGSGVVNSSLTSVGTLVGLTVSGQTSLNSTFEVTGISTFSSTVDINADLDVDGHTDLDNVSISGVTTTSGLLDIDAGGQANTFKVEDLTDNRIVIVGSGGELEDDSNLTFDGSTLTVGVGLDVDGHTELDNVNISGVVTSTSFVKNGGTSSEFLKADGSVDTNTYLTSFTETNDLSSAVTWANVPDANITESSVTQHEAALSITESQITDLQSYLTSYTETQTLDDVLTLGDSSSTGLSVGVATATSFVKSSNSGGFLKADGTEDTNTYLTSFTETNDLSSAVTWANVPDVNITQSSVTQHEAALSITESQITDLQSYLTSYTETQTLDDVLTLGNSSSTGLSVGVVTTTALKGFNYLQAPHGTTVTYSVTVASKTSAHRYNGSGSSSGYLIDGVESPFLTFTPGRTYRFTLSSSDMTSHPFRFYLEADKTTSYTTNVTSTSTYTEIVVTDTTPTVLHYQCSAHDYMGNAVQVNSNKIDTPYQIDGLKGANITGIATATSFVKSSNSGGFLKADGTEDTSTYLTSFTETNDLSTAVTWANVPDANITESSVTQHQSALSITESQISDLQTYLTSYTETQTLNDVLALGNSSSTGLSVGVVTATSLETTGDINSTTAVKVNGTSVIQSAVDEALALAIALG